MSIKVESFTRENVCDKKIILYGCNSAAKLALNVLKNWGAECVAVCIKNLCLRGYRCTGLTK